MTSVPPASGPKVGVIEEIVGAAEPQGGLGFPLPSKGPLPGGPPKVVLVIDDDPSVLDLMQRVCSKAGFRVVTSRSGEEGLRLAREEKPDLITLDVIMPGMDGWTVLETLKKDSSLAAIPVVVVTIADERDRGIALGAIDYFVKPVDHERLLSALGRIRRDRVA